MASRKPIRAGLLLALALGLQAGGCGFLWVTRHVKLVPRPPMKSATLPQLIALLNQQAHALKTLNARVDLQASTGGSRTGTITKYHDVVAYLLIRKPRDIRLIGTFTIIGTIFDMASTDNHFELYIPGKSRFYTGLNNRVPAQVKNPLERLRPHVILQALLVNSVRAGERVALMNDHAAAGRYDLLVLRKGPAGIDHLVRKIVMNRRNLLPQRQVIYDAAGDPGTQVLYSHFRRTQGVMLPWQVKIIRPRDEYQLVLKFQKARLNQPLARSKFELRQPSGSRLINLNQPAGSRAAHAKSQP